MTKTVIHIGLHKTATRFFQHQLFAAVAEQGVIFNPVDIMPALHALFLKPQDATLQRAAVTAVANFREREPQATLLISKPDIPGDMYDPYDQYVGNLALLHQLFPDAHLVYVPRHPADWLLSAYRQSLVKGAGGPIEIFLNYHDGAFQPKRAPLVNGMRNVNALELPVTAIYEKACHHFGENSVSLMCFEDVRANKRLVFDHFSSLLDLPQLQVPAAEKIKNRSFSALAIKLFCAGNSSGHQRQYAEAVPPVMARYVHRPLRKLRANFIKHGWDSVLYRDWDLLARNDMREQLEAHYDGGYARLRQISARTLGLDATT